jgi:ferredoxin-NADP reductase/bacterioferritin-associated ferredoxin
MLKDKKSRFVCVCARVTEEDIDQKVNNNKCSLQELQQSLGCGIECGSCVPELQEILGIKAWHPTYAFCQVVESTKSLKGSSRFFEIKLFPEDVSSYPDPVLGQNVIIRLTENDGQAIERTYTIVDFDPILRSLTVIAKHRVDGKLTPVFAQNASNESPLKIEITEPVGGSLVVAEQQPIVFYVAGSGITPALAYLRKYTGTHPIYLDYSASSQEEFLFKDFFALKKEQSTAFDYTLRDTSISGRIDADDISKTAAKHPNVQYLICGPDAYTQMVSNVLRRMDIPAVNIHAEAFSVVHTPQKKTSSIKHFAYTMALFICLIPLFLLFDKTEHYRPHGQANVGHEKLKCAACHQASTGSFRQQIQAKVDYFLGYRETNPQFGNKPVNTRTCIGCHANPDDRHPAQRFLEPKYEEARQTLGAHQCISCHREHSKRRVTLTDTSFCLHCHSKTIVKNDPTAPTHQSLIRNKQWNSCLQCHDYHGNHKAKIPIKLEDAHKINAINAYFNLAKNPYGSVIYKAKLQKKDEK